MTTADPAPKNFEPTGLLVRFWILLSAVLVGAGWILSAVGQLNRAGYALFLLPLAVVFLVRWRKAGLPSREDFQRWRGKFLKRFRRRAPQIFLLIAALSFLGGCLYPPLNCDANAYRLPRVMHWLWAGQWHWIHSMDARMNISACGMEWLSAPLILFSHTDRLLFLINWISYLLLPGLIFGLFIQLQVRPRVAWWWAWWLSSGWCFALQAGSVANDSLAAVYILAAVNLALCARRNKSVTDLWLSLLAAALATGVKQTDVPLAALWLIAAWPARSLFWQNFWRTMGVAGWGLLVSIAPISVLNYCRYGSWMPLNVAGVTAIGNFRMTPFWGIVGNAFCIPIQNLVPPFYGLLPPFYSSWPVLWNEGMRHFVQTPFGSHFACFESFGQLSVVYFQGFTEGTVGLGFGVCVLIFSTVYELRRLGKNGTVTTSALSSVPVLRLLRLAPWGLLLLFMAEVGSYENARQLAPYYVFLFPLWLVRAGQSQVVRQPAWQRLGGQIMVLTALLLVTLSEHPLFPAQTLFQMLRSKFPNAEFLSDEYAHYLESILPMDAARRNYLKQALPTDGAVVGYYAKIPSQDEPGLWLPYGRRRVEIVLPGDSPSRLRSLGIHYVVVDGNATPGNSGGYHQVAERLQCQHHWGKHLCQAICAVHETDHSLPCPSELAGCT